MLLALPLGSIASDVGSICVAPVEKPNAGIKSLTNPSGGNQVRSYTIQVDNRSPVDVAAEQGVAIKGISIAGRHLIRIKGDGKDIAAFRFQFDNYDSHNLCLWFKPLYETWSLTPVKGHGKTCVCP